MRCAAILTLLLSTSLNAQPRPLTGTWELHMEWPEGSSDGTCVFQQDGDSLTGSCGGTERFPIKGRVDGSQIVWQFDVDQGAFRMEFAGELDAERATIRGTCKVVGANSGEFTLKRVTDAKRSSWGGRLLVDASAASRPRSR
jgi:hypothetical protein